MEVQYINGKKSNMVANICSYNQIIQQTLNNQLIVQIEDKDLGVIYKVSARLIAPNQQNQQHSQDSLSDCKEYFQNKHCVLLNTHLSQKIVLVVDRTFFSRRRGLLGGGATNSKDTPANTENAGQKQETKAEDVSNKQNEEEKEKETKAQSLPINKKKQSNYSYSIEFDRLGNSAYEQVVFYQDQHSGENRAKKCFKNQNQYIEECKIYEELQNGHTDQEQKLRELVALPEKLDSEEQTIHFAPGLCSIHDLMSEQAFVFTGSQALSVFSSMLQYVLLMKQKGSYLCSLQPQNVILIPIQQSAQKYQPKIIDVGRLLKKNQETAGADTSAHSNSSLGANPNQKEVQTNSDDRHNKIITSIFKILIQMLLAKRLEKQYENEDKEIQEIVDNIKRLHESTNCVGLSNFLQFLQENRTSEKNYDANRLFELCQQTQKNSFQIIDSQKQVLEKILMKQKINQVKVEYYLSSVFGLKMNFDQEGSFEANYSNAFELLPALDLLLQGQEYENIIITGEAGSGKSVCLLKIMKLFYESNKFSNLLPIYVNLGEFAANKLNEQLTTLISTINQQIGSNQQQIVIVLDSFNELQNRDIKIYDELKLAFKQRLKNLFVATRNRYATNQDLLNCFGSHKLIYLCPLNLKTRKIFIQKAADVFKEYQHAMNGFELFPQLDNYDQILSQNLLLNQISLTPLFLLLALVVLPDLQRENQFSLTTRYELIEIFIKLNLRNKLHKLARLDYNINQIYFAPNKKNQENIKNEAIIREIEEDFTNFNQFLSWNMLQNRNCKVQPKIANNIVKGIQNSNNKKVENVEDILRSISPIPTSCYATFQPFFYIHKTFYEYFIAQSIIEETLKAQGNAFDQNTTKLKYGFLAHDLDILSLVGEHIMQTPIELQYSLYFETWYKSVLLSRKVQIEPKVQQNSEVATENQQPESVSNRTDDKLDKLQKEFLKRIASNAINLMASSTQCDLSERDFTDCQLYYAQLCKRDISKSKFDRSVMIECDLTQSKIDECSFLKANLTGMKYSLESTYSKKLSAESRINAISPDGKQVVASERSSNKIYIWDLDSNEVLKQLGEHSMAINSIAYSRDGQKLVSVGDDNFFKVWQLSNLKEIASIEYKAGKDLSNVTLSLNDKFVAAVSSEKTIVVWQVGNEDKIMTLNGGQSSSIVQLEFSPTEFLLASGCSDQTIKIWDIFTKKVTATIKGLDENYPTMIFQPKGKLIAFNNSEREIILYNLKNKKQTAKLTSHPGNIISLKFSRDSKLLLAGDNSGNLRVWDLRTNTIMKQFQSKISSLRFIALQPDNRLVAISLNDKQIATWNLDYTRDIIAPKGHTDSITCLAYCPDKKTLATGSRDNTIIFWDLNTMNQIVTLVGHTQQIYAMAFSRDGRRLASASFDKTIKLWDVEKKSEIRTFSGHTKLVYCVVFTQDNENLVSCSQDKTIKLWNQNTAEAKATLEGHTSLVYSVAVSRNGQVLASGSFDNKIKLWDLDDKKEIHTFSEHTAKVLSVAFSPTEDLLASGSYEGAINIYDTKERKLITTFTQQSKQIYSLNFSKDGKLLASASEDQSVYLWDLKQQKISNCLTNLDSAAYAVDFQYDSEIIAYATKQKFVRFWNFNMQKPKDIIKAHDQAVRSIFFSAESQIPITCSLDHSIKLWNFTEKKEVAKLEAHTEGVLYVRLSKDGKTLASVSDDQTVKLWDLETRTVIASMTGHTARVREVDFSYDGKLLATASLDGTARVWDPVEKKELHKLDKHTSEVYSVCFSCDNKTMASSSADKKIILWDISNFTDIHKFEGHTDGIMSVVYSPNGKRLVSGSRDNQVIVWDPEEKKLLQKLTGQQDVWALGFTADGSVLATGSSDSMLRLWDFATLKDFATIQENSGSIFALAFSKDNSTLALANGDGTIILHNLNVSKLLEKRAGHSPMVLQIAFSPDGKLLATVREGQQIMLWDLKAKRLLTTFAQQFNKTYSLQFSADSNILAYGSASEGKIFLWNIQTQKQLYDQKLLEEFKPRLQLPAPVLFPYQKKLTYTAGTEQKASQQQANFREVIFEDKDQAKRHFKGAFFND